ncbi:MAG: hypothetical protein ACYC3Q_14970 [Gemmatimonadaceae bacterium]
MRFIQRLLPAVVLSIVAGCGDISAPRAADVVVDPKPQLALTEGAGYSARFVVSASQSTVFSDGVNTLYFPAGAVCDPATSSYGPGMWDQPCDPIGSDLTINVVATVAKGLVTLDFSPSVRFNPSRSVWFTSKNDAIKTTTEPGKWAVFFNPGNGQLQDEGATDRSLVTYLDRTNGLALRRIKHFTGYSIILGTVTDCQPYVDEGCYPEGSVQ